MMQKEAHLEPEGIEGDKVHRETDEQRTFKIKSSLFGNIRDELSEIPCRVSSDLHEWRNDIPAVSARDSAKLNCR